jgi:hypothetical protein
MEVRSIDVKKGSSQQSIECRDGMNSSTYFNRSSEWFEGLPASDLKRLQSCLETVSGSLLQGEDLIFLMHDAVETALGDRQIPRQIESVSKLNLEDSFLRHPFTALIRNADPCLPLDAITVVISSCFLWLHHCEPTINDQDEVLKSLGSLRQRLTLKRGLRAMSGLATKYAVSLITEAISFSDLIQRLSTDERDEHEEKSLKGALDYFSDLSLFLKPLGEMERAEPFFLDEHPCNNEATVAAGSSVPGMVNVPEVLGRHSDLLQGAASHEIRRNNKQWQSTLEAATTWDKRIRPPAERDNWGDHFQETLQAMQNVSSALELEDPQTYRADINCLLSFVLAINPWKAARSSIGELGVDLSTGKIARYAPNSKQVFRVPVDNNAGYRSTIVQFQVDVPSRLRDVLIEARRIGLIYPGYRYMDIYSEEDFRKPILKHIALVAEKYYMPTIGVDQFRAQLPLYMTATNFSLAEVYWLTGASNHQSPVNCHYETTEVARLSDLYDKAVTAYFDGGL